MSRFAERPSQSRLPVILEITPAMLIESINRSRAAEPGTADLDPIPLDAKVSVFLPRGGDLSGTEFVFDNRTKFAIRWEQQQ